MSFSQAWDAGFKSLLIFVGTVFVWLMFIEARLPSRTLSELAMTGMASLLAIGFFIWRRRQCVAERNAADAHVAALLREEI